MASHFEWGSGNDSPDDGCFRRSPDAEPTPASLERLESCLQRRLGDGWRRRADADADPDADAEWTAKLERVASILKRRCRQDQVIFSPFSHDPWVKLD